MLERFQKEIDWYIKDIDYYTEKIRNEGNRKTWHGYTYQERIDSHIKNKQKYEQKLEARKNIAKLDKKTVLLLIDDLLWHEAIYVNCGEDTDIDDKRLSKVLDFYCGKDDE